MIAGSTPDSARDDDRQQLEEAVPTESSSDGQRGWSSDPADGPDGSDAPSSVDAPGSRSVVVPLLDESAQLAGGLEGVIGTGLAGFADAFHPLSGVSDAFSDLAGFRTASALAHIEWPAFHLTNVTEVLGTSLMDVVLPALDAVRIPALSLPEATASVFSTAGLLDGFSTTTAVWSVMEPHLTSVAKAVNSAVACSGITERLAPISQLTGLTDQMNSHVAGALAGLPSVFTSLPDLSRVIGPVVSDSFVGLQKVVQDVLAIRPLLADFIGGYLADLMAGAQSIADWAKRLKPSVLAEARYAYEAYIEGDPEPMKRFLRRCLRLWPVLEDHCQALAVAMCERRWEQEADLADDQSVRQVLIQYARQGCDREYEHQIRGKEIGYIPEGWQQPDTVPGPEDLVLPRLVPWAKGFETAPVRYVVSRLNEQEKAVVRAWAENAPLPWTKAPALVQQDESQGDHNRRKLIRLGREWRRREDNRRGLQ
jgi:hypothetical protein